MYQWCKAGSVGGQGLCLCWLSGRKKVSPHTSFWKLRRRFPHGTVACKRKKFFRNGVGYIGQVVKGTGIPLNLGGAVLIDTLDIVVCVGRKNALS